MKSPSPPRAQQRARQQALEFQSRRELLAPRAESSAPWAAVAGREAHTGTIGSFAFRSAPITFGSSLR